MPCKKVDPILIFITFVGNETVVNDTCDNLDDGSDTSRR